MERVKLLETPGDPRQKTELAHDLYRDGKVAEALETTTSIMAEHGLYMVRYIKVPICSAPILSQSFLGLYHTARELSMLFQRLEAAVPPGS